MNRPARSPFAVANRSCRAARTLIMVVMAAAGATIAGSACAAEDELSLDAALKERLHLTGYTIQAAGVAAQAGMPGEAGGKQDDAIQIDVKLGDRGVRLELERSSVRAPDARLIVSGGGTRIERALPKEQTFAGRVAGAAGSRVAFSRVRGLGRAVIDLGEGELWYLQSVAEADAKLDAATYIAFSSSQVGPLPTWCGGGIVPDGGAAVQRGSDRLEGGNLCNKQAQIGFDADFLFYQQNGSDVNATVADIESVLNAMNLIYVRDTNVSFIISATIVRTDATLYTGTTPGDLLNQLRTEWETNQTGVTRDLAHLMTGLALGPNGGVIGVGFVNVVCGNAAYAISLSRFTTNLAVRVGLTAHEIGHNFSAGHCDGDPDCYIMCSGIGGCSGSVTRFGSRDAASIRSHAASRTCLTPVGPWPTPIAPGAIPDRFTIASTTTTNLDVLANDSEGNCQAVTIGSFDAVSASGATITRGVGIGPGGRDVLRFTPAANAAGNDQFNYTASDPDGNTTSARVFVAITRPRDPDVVGTTAPGLDVSYYRFPGENALSDFATLVPFATGTTPNVNFATTAGNFAGSGRADRVAATFSGSINVPVAGDYTFFTESDDGSQLYIDEGLVVDNDGLHGMVEVGGTVTLTAGLHAFRVEFFENGGGAGCIARWLGPAGSGVVKQVIPAVRFPGGLTARYYDLPAPLSALPSFTGRTVYKRSTVSEVNVPSTSGVFLDSGRADDVMAVFTGYVSVATLGTYTFYTESDDGSKLYIGTSLVVDNDGPHGMVERSGQITLRPGLHALRVEFYEGGGGAGLIVRYESASLGIAKTVIPVAALRRPIPCPADYNGDGNVNPDDLGDFITCYFSSSPCASADFNRDGNTDPDDLGDFITTFFGPAC